MLFSFLKIKACSFVNNTGGLHMETLLGKMRKGAYFQSSIVYLVRLLFIAV